MLEWLKQRVISWFLSRHVGKWIVVDRQNLHGETHSDVWKLVAEDLAIKTDCLDDIDNIPFRVRSGTVKKLTVLWRKEQSVSLQIDTVSVILESRITNALTPEQKRRIERQAKQQLLEQWESRLDENLSSDKIDAAGAAKEGEEGGNSAAYRALVDKLEVTISRIDFVYYDPSGTLGAHIDTIALENHKPSESSDLLEHTIKSAKVSGFSLFIDASGTQAEDGARALPGGHSAMSQAHAHRDKCYLLHPCTASVRIGYDSPKAKFDLSRPRISVIATIPELAVELRREQLLCVVKVADLFDSSKRSSLSRPGRPAAAVAQNPKAWWHYAYSLILRDVRDRRRRRTAAYLMERRRSRVRYVDLYLRQRHGKLAGNETKEIDALEDDLGFHEIVFFRCSAIRQLQSHAGRIERREHATNASSTWFSGWGWKSGSGAASGGTGLSRNEDAAGSGPSDSAGAEGESADSNPFHGMTEDEREALFSAMAGGGSEVGATYTSLMQSKNPEQQLYTVAVSLDRCSGRLVDAGKLDVSASFNDATVKVKGRVQAVTWQGELVSLNVLDRLGRKPLCKQHNTVSTPCAVTAGGSDLLSIAMTSDRSITPPRTTVRLRVAALDLTADPHFLAAFSAFWEVHHASRYDRPHPARTSTPTAAGASRKSSGQEQSSVLALGRDEILSLDLDVNAPNIYICEHGSTGFSGSVLMVRLGHLSIKDAPPDTMPAEASGGAEAVVTVNKSNQYIVEVERVGVDLLHNAEVQEDDVYCESMCAIVSDTRLRARISSSLVLQTASSLRDTYSLDAALPSLSICVGEASLMDVTRIVASWTKNRETHMSYHGEQALVKAKVLVKGLESQSGWCWRWLALKSGGIELFREEDELVLDQLVSLDTLQASSEHYKGLWVISLLPWQDDTRDEAALLIYAEAQHSTLLALIWQAQKERNPSRDWSAPVVRMDTVIATSKDATPVSDEAAATDTTARYEVSFRVGMMRCVIEKKSKSAKSLLDLSVNDLSGSVLAEASQILTTAQVVKVHITGSGQESDTAPYDLLSQVADDTGAALAPDSSTGITPASAVEEGGDLPCIGLQITSKEGAETVCKIRMPKAFALRIDPHTVAGFSQLQAQVWDNWRNLRKVATGTAQGGMEPSSEVDASLDSCEANVLADGSAESSPSEHRTGYSSLMVLRGTGEVPEQCLGDEEENECGKMPAKTRMSTTLDAVGLHLLLIDDDFHELVLLKVQRVNLVKTDFTDCAVAVVGTLGKLEISDLSAPASVHPKFMTVSEEADALVHVDIHLYDKTSVVREKASVNHWRVSIFRPRITVLWRFVNEFLQYQRSFYSTSAQGPTTATEASGATTAAENTALPTHGAASLQTEKTENAVPSGGCQQRGTVVKISLEHPELILPRSSTCTDAFLADLGRVDIERASRHSSDQWTVSFKETHLDTVHAVFGGREAKLSCVHDLDGTAQINFCEAEAAGAEPEMSVNINLGSLRGSISDSQYALLMSIVGENFTEKRAEVVGSASPYKTVRRQMSHLAEDGTLGDTLGNIIDLARGLTAHLIPTSAYKLTIRDIELALNRSQPTDGDLESWDINPLLRARAGDLVVRYESFVGAVGGGSSQRLDSCTSGSLSRFELIDTRVGAVCKSEPLFAVRRPAAGADLGAGVQKADLAGGDASTSVGSDQDGHRGQELKEDHYILLQYFKLSQGHTGINLMLRNVDTVFDVGLLMNAISWLGTSNGPAVDTEAFRYVVNRTGGFRVQTELPDSSIHLVTAFDRADADGFHMKGSLAVTYASSASEDVLHVKVDDLALKMRETAAAAGAKSNHNMDVVRPCGVMASWQWYRELSSLSPETLSEVSALLEAEHNRRPKFFFAASDLRAMVTYEHMMLIMRVYSCLTTTLAGSAQGESSPSRASPSKYPGAENALSPKAQENVALACEAKQHAELDLRIQGSGIMLTLIDDYDGRWIPLVRVGLPKSNLNGRSSAMDILLMGARLDYFHAPTSSWKAAVEDAELKVRYLDWEDGAHRQTQIHIDAQDALITHVSRAAIDSCLSALQAWSKDRRTWGENPGGHGEVLTKSTSYESLTQSQGSARDASTFVPYSVQNLLAEALLLITEDGTEYRIESQSWMELSYAQVWGRGSELSKYARDSNDTGINNMVCLQLASASRIFGSMSIEMEHTSAFDIEPENAETGTPALKVCCQLYRRNGQKFLRISSMVSVRNCTHLPLVSAILGAEDSALIQMGVVPTSGVIGVPLHLAREGILVFKPLVSGLEYEWCDTKTEAIRLSTVHDGTFRVTQMVDAKFQRIFGASMPADTSLLHWYSCANDLQSVGLRHGVLYITEKFLCHYSNVVGNVVKEIIPIASIVDLKKVNTALVIPNAIRVQTAQRTYYFRTFKNRADSFREIVKLLPNKSVVSQEDDVDEKTRRFFRLEPSDTILSMYSVNWHHDPGFTEGKVLLTSKHLLFMSNDDSSTRKRKIPWANVVNVEKRKSFLVRNNAVCVSTANDCIFLSSSKWDRDKVVDEEMLVLWRAEQQGVKSESFSSTDDAHQFADSGVRCRTLTCNVVDALRTPQAAPKGGSGQVTTDKVMEYERQLQRSRDSLSFTVSIVDGVTQGRGVDRKAGNPCIVELHSPWILENLTCCNLELQLVDKTRNVIARAAVSQGSSRQLTSVDLRRELRLRARAMRADAGASQFGPWSSLVSVYSAEDVETENTITVPDLSGDGLQEVVVEIMQDATSCGFRLCLYNRFWLLNLSGLRVECQSGPEESPSRLLPLGSPVGWDGGEEVELRVAGYGPSSPFPVTDQSEHSATVALSAADLAGYGTLGGEHALGSAGTRELYLEMSTSAGVGRFDRTIVITVAPVIVVENCLPDEDILVWQRATRALPALNEEKGPRVTLAAGKSRPLYPEGIRKYCRLSINLKADGVNKSCACFSPEVWWGMEGQGGGVGGGGANSEPILLRLSSGRLVMLSSEMNQTNTVMLKVRDTLGAVPHSLFNRSYFSLEFRQVGDDQKRNLRVEPWKEEPLVWPEPTDLPHRLVLVKIDGILVPRSVEVDGDELLSKSTRFYLDGQMKTLESAMEGGEVGGDHVPRQLAMGAPAGSSGSRGEQAPGPRVRHQGRLLTMMRCQNGAAMWHDRDGSSDRRNYRLRNLPACLQGSFLFQLPCYLGTSAVEVLLDSPATVYTFFVPPPRDGGLPSKLLGTGWKQEVLPNAYFDWDGQVGNPEKDRFVIVLSKRFDAAGCVILPSHTGETLMGLAVRSGPPETTGDGAQRNAGKAPADAASAGGWGGNLRPASWRGARFVLRLKNPDQHRAVLDSNDLRAPATHAPPLLIELTGPEVMLTGRGVVGHQPADAHAVRRVVQLPLAPTFACLLCEAQGGAGWVVEESGDGRGSGGHGVWVNNESVTNRIVLQHGDIVFLAPAGNASSWMSGPLDAASDEADAGIVYIFEDFCEHQKQRVQSASKLEATTRLEAKGTKVIHVHVGDLPETRRLSVKGQNTLLFEIAAPAMNVILEDDEEVLFCSMHTIKASVLSDGVQQQFVAQVLGMQVDNQFDTATKFPVVLSVTPSNQAALNIAIVKHLSSSTQHRFYQNIRIDLGEAFVFLDDRLMVRVAAFLSKVLPEQPSADSEAEHDGAWSGDISALPPAVNAWEILQDGVMPEIADLRVAVLTGKSIGTEAGHNAGALSASRAAARAGPVLYVRRFQVRPITLHLTLMSTGEGGGRGGRGGGAVVVRQYAGAMLERMIRQVRIDDVVVNVPGQELGPMLISQSRFSALIFNILLKSLKKSFYSAKFMLKGLDAWSDRLLGLQTDQQMAGERELKRLRPIDDEWLLIADSASSSVYSDVSGGSGVSQMASMSSSNVIGLGGRAIDKGVRAAFAMPQFAGGMMKQVVKKGVSVANTGVRAAGSVAGKGVAAAGEAMRNTDVTHVGGRAMLPSFPGSR